MKKIIVLIILLLILFYNKKISFADIFSKSFGRDYVDIARSVLQTSDGEFIIAGLSDRFGESEYDIWLIKLYKNGEEDWNEIYGTRKNDGAYSICETEEKNYIIVGFTEKRKNNRDVGIIKINKFGIREWAKTVGGNKNDECYSIQPVNRNEYILVGYTESFGAGGKDVWVIVIDDTGDKNWGRVYGGNQDDVGYSIFKTFDAGFIICGYTESFDVKNKDIWIIRLDKYRDKRWTKKFGGEKDDVGYSILQTPDEDYIIAGYTESYGAGGKDVWIIKLDKNGEKVWDKTFGYQYNDCAYTIQPTKDNGYIIAGYTETSKSGDSDYWIIKIDSEGKFPK